MEYKYLGYVTVAKHTAHLQPEKPVWVLSLDKSKDLRSRTDRILKSVEWFGLRCSYEDIIQ